MSGNLSGAMSQYQCASCTFSSNNLQDYATHIRDEHGQRVLFECSLCSEQFDEEAELTVHQETHASNLSKPATVAKQKFECNRCNKSFFSIEALIVHEGSHGIEPSFTCGVCGCATTTHRSLEIHMRTHTNERPFKCSECDMAFRQGSHLKAHAQSRHSTAKPFKCEHCGYTAAVKASVTAHKRAVHLNIAKNLNVKCPQSDCDFITSSHSNLARHTSLKHPKRVQIQTNPALKNTWTRKSIPRARRGRGRGRGEFTGKTQNGTVTPFKVTFKDSSGISQQIMIEGDLTINIDWDSREFDLESRAPLQAA